MIYEPDLKNEFNTVNAFNVQLNPRPSAEEIIAFEEFSKKRSFEFKVTFPWSSDLYLYTKVMRTSYLSNPLLAMVKK